MNQLPLWALILSLLFLIFCSAFFSGSETSMMSLNKHRLKFLAQNGNKKARLALKLLERPDRLLGVILLGNNFINILAASLATLIGIQLWGDAGIAIMTVVLTVVVLLFGEVTPKTFAAANSEKCAFSAAWILTIFLKILYPVVVIINMISAAILKPLGLSNFSMNEESVSKEEIKSILHTSHHIDENKQDMILGVLYLEDINVEDIMVTRHELVGLDLDLDWGEAKSQIISSEYARLLIYRNNINEVQGILHIVDTLKLYRDQLDISKENICRIMHKPYYIPEGTSLRKQLQLFQQHKRQTGIVVDEYGDVIGLITLEDILEYVVGDLGLQEIAEDHDDDQEIIQKSENVYQIQGTLSLKYINKELDWDLPVDGPKTLSGLILEELGQFPRVGTLVKVGDYDLSVISFSDNRINQVLVTVHETEEH